MTGGNWNDPGTNYSAGNPDYAKLKLNPEKFRVAGLEIFESAAAYDAKLLSVGAMDAASAGSNGRKRIVSWTQVVGVSPSTKKAVVAGNFPQPTQSEAAS